MNAMMKRRGTRVMAILLSLAMIFSLFSTTALAAQENDYHDPAENWMKAANRTNELDVKRS